MPSPWAGYMVVIFFCIYIRLSSTSINDMSRVLRFAFFLRVTCCHGETYISIKKESVPPRGSGSNTQTKQGLFPMAKTEVRAIETNHFIKMSESGANVIVH